MPNEAFLDRVLTMEVGRCTEAAAIAASTMIGRGDKEGADQAAVTALREALGKLEIDGTVVIGEGERDEAPMLYIGEKVGTGRGPKVDIALDPLEGTDLTAKAMANALAVVAMAQGGTLLNAPDVYMDKIAIGPGYPEGLVDLDAPHEDNILALAKAKGVPAEEITLCVLDRPRHDGIIKAARKVGARVFLIPDGDVAGVFHTTEPETGIDMYLGRGGAPEGVLAAAALRCVGGQMQGRLHFRNDDERARAERLGVQDLDRKYSLRELASGDVIFAATGVTNGTLLDGVRWDPKYVHTHTIVMRSKTGTIRYIRARTRRK
ncbi:class II fructose-bisphosphatase [Amphiplicatus metriothermophilus]|uniref:Fructose-1,6-bisphosphatase n=1 Tax=Amphiplicatus metriothermophilus TaxID=1519374 RepID=A0A239PQC1_9PROT|nr:class II fructose-bisphosphatase [Amphiplicatus metriothermophilus]MBB5518701.1 fructose-1,6-bisphosphatase II / sedoheptulose-1,7-bisphosphatase [Amphiplicatus metriothermophilus]SNT72142.1 fructose-1,6-bisphosphatase II / sedoheptulose-1,7-bisphosphatase [Amphiplicatus metriothermophilus]